MLHRNNKGTFLDVIDIFFIINTFSYVAFHIIITYMYYMYYVTIHAFHKFHSCVTDSTHCYTHCLYIHMHASVRT